MSLLDDLDDLFAKRGMNHGERELADEVRAIASRYDRGPDDKPVGDDDASAVA